MNIKSMQCTLLFLLLLAGCSADPKIEEPSQKPEKETESMTCKTYLDTMMTEKNLTRTDTEHLIWSRGGKSGDQFSIDLTKQRISVKDPEMTYGGKERPEDDYELGILTNEETNFLYRYILPKDSFITNGDPEENTAAIHKELQNELTDVIESLEAKGCPSLYKKGEDGYLTYGTIKVGEIDKAPKIIDPIDIMKCKGLTCELRNDPKYIELDDAYSLEIPMTQHFSKDLNSLVKQIKKIGQNNRVGFSVIFTHGTLNDPTDEHQIRSLMVQNFIRDVYLPESDEVGPYLYFVDLDKHPLEAAVSVKGVDERYTNFKEDVPNSMHSFIWEDEGLVFKGSITDDEQIIEELWDQLHTKSELTGTDLDEKYGEGFLENYKHIHDFEWQKLHGVREIYQEMYGF